LVTRGLEVELEIDPHLRLSASTEALLFRAAQEALRNVLNHAEAHRVTVRLNSRDSRVVLEVQDDGRGFSVADTPAEGHFGLRMLEDLAGDGDGQLAVESRPGEGTLVHFGLPLR
jgi:signal transduction histidine kinase